MKNQKQYEVGQARIGMIVIHSDVALHQSWSKDSGCIRTDTGILVLELDLFWSLLNVHGDLTTA